MTSFQLSSQHSIFQLPSSSCCRCCCFCCCCCCCSSETKLIHLSKKMTHTKTYRKFSSCIVHVCTFSLSLAFHTTNISGLSDRVAASTHFSSDFRLLTRFCFFLSPSKPRLRPSRAFQPALPFAEPDSWSLLLFSQPYFCCSREREEKERERDEQKGKEREGGCVRACARGRVRACECERGGA